MEPKSENGQPDSPADRFLALEMEGLMPQINPYLKLLDELAQTDPQIRRWADQHSAAELNEMIRQCAASEPHRIDRLSAAIRLQERKRPRGGSRPAYKLEMATAEADREIYQLPLDGESPLLVLAARRSRPYGVLPTMLPIAGVKPAPELVDKGQPQLAATDPERSALVPSEALLSRARMVILAAPMSPSFDKTPRRARAIKLRALMLYDMLGARVLMRERDRLIRYTISRAELEAGLWPPSARDSRHGARRWYDIREALHHLRSVALATGLYPQYQPRSPVVSVTIDFQAFRGNGPHFDPGLLQTCVWEAIGRKNPLPYLAYAGAIQAIDSSPRGGDSVITDWPGFVQALFADRPEPRSGRARRARIARVRAALDWLAAFGEGAFDYRLLKGDRIRLHRASIRAIEGSA